MSAKKEKPRVAPKTAEETTGALNRAFRQATESGERSAKKKVGKRGAASAQKRSSKK